AQSFGQAPQPVIDRRRAPCRQLKEDLPRLLEQATGLGGEVLRGRFLVQRNAAGEEVGRAVSHLLQRLDSLAHYQGRLFHAGIAPDRQTLRFEEREQPLRDRGRRQRL